MKEIIFNRIMEIINDRIESTKKAISAAKESRDNETKCSSGDKYETGRTMMNFELEKSRVLLNKTLNLKNELSQIDLHKQNKTVTLGSLVRVTNACYFISVGIGKLEVENETVIAISLASPIGKLLNNKNVGNKFKFRGEEITITEII
jgi:transcription elongation GreA/GreB family factor